MLHKIKFAPGINREGTQYSVGQGWWDCDKVRFRMGRPEQIGGWQKYIDASYLGVCRSLQDWSTASATNYLGIGTNLKFYVETGGVLVDITPLRATTSVGTLYFTPQNFWPTLYVTDTAHGASAGDYVTYYDAVTLGENISAAVLNQEYEIESITDSDNYIILAKDPVTGDPVEAAAGDGPAVQSTVYAEYQINTGTNAYVSSTGYSTGVWGGGGAGTTESNAWGGGGALLFSGQLRLYSQDVFGDDLIFNPRAGGIYFWDQSTFSASTRAVELSVKSATAGYINAPVAALQIMVSPVDKHVIAFGANPIGQTAIDPMLVRWSDQETINDWNPTVINSAGGTLLSSGSVIIGAVRTRHEIIIYTDTSVHAMRFSGAPYVYSFSPVGENVSVVGPNAMIAVGDAVYSMDLEGFYIYQGAVTRLPCTVLSYVFNGIDKSNLYKVFASHNPDDSEVTWFYPVTGSDIERYVTYNYLEQVWTIGSFERGAWIQAMSRNYPIAASADIANPKVNYLYNQEVGYNAEGQQIGGYVESGQVEVASEEFGDGESFMFIDRIIPDFRLAGNANNVDFDMIIKGTDYPLQALTERYSSTIMSATGQSDVRVRARQIALRLESNGTDYSWAMGDFRFDMRTDGKR